MTFFIFSINQKMYLPVRCFTCNNVLGHLANKIQNLKEINEYPPKPTFYKLHNIHRYCCKSILMSSVPIFESDFVERDTSYYTHYQSLNVKRYLTTN
jgi:DNA-directed RNA polymerase subunit N (RpoN/RPB10)